MAKPVACNDCTNEKCEIRGDEPRAKFPCTDFENDDWNVFALYTTNGTVAVDVESVTKAKQATAEIMVAVEKAGKEIHELCEKWRGIGADDTASQDEILHVLGRKVRYGE